MRIKLFENFDNSDAIDLNKVEQDFNDILVELRDDPKFEIELRTATTDSNDYLISSGSDEVVYNNVVWVKIGKLGYRNTFIVEDLKDYLDMMKDYMDIYYDYQMEFNYLVANSGTWRFHDNYDLHLRQMVTKIWIEFSHIKNKRSDEN
jgi:hypothetical protein